MPTVVYSKKELLSLLGKTLSDQDLESFLAMLGAPVEYLEDDEICVEAFPNRPDFLSVEGLARGLKYFLGLDSGIYVPKLNKGDYLANIDPSVREIRPYAVCGVIKGLNMSDELIQSMMQVQEKLHTTHSRNRKIASIGIYDLDTISFPITYKAVSKDYTFVPLEYSREMSISQILAEHPKGKAYAHLAPGPKYVVWEDSKGQTLSFPPIINSAHTAVTPDTKNIFIDVTGTNPIAVEQALNILIYMFYDRGGKVYSVSVGEKGKMKKVEYPRLDPWEMDLDISYVNRLLGLDLGVDEALKLLGRMGYGGKAKPGTKQKKEISVSIPRYRTDILHPMDIVEDIAIAYGYQNFKPAIPNISTIASESKEIQLSRGLASIMAGMGFLEACNYHLTSKDILLEKMMRKPGRYNIVETLNAVNHNYTVFRDSILPQLLDVLSQNKHHPYPQNLFDIGRVAIIPGKGKSPVESVFMGGVMADSRVGYSDIKSVVEALFREIGLKPGIEGSSHPSFFEGRCARIMVGNKSVGILGEIHPMVLENFGIEVPVAGFEMDVGFLLGRSSLFDNYYVS